MKCEICNNESKPNLVICSDKCGEVRKIIYDLDRKYFPTRGCGNCWGDLHQGCSDECKKEFQESSRFMSDLWKLVNFIYNK